MDLDAEVAELSGGERRRVALAAVLLAGHDVLVLDEPTNHLDVEVIGWLAGHLSGLALAKRWWWSATTAGSSTPSRTKTWEVHDGAIDAYDGGYAAYVLARAERMRLAAGTEARRRNLMRKELAWLRRGPPARTSKPKFRIQAANELIANEPPPRDSLVLQRFATTRLGKDVFDLHRLRLEVGDRTILDRIDWSIGPGARIGLVGVNGTGKTSVLRLLAGELSPAAGTIKRGTTLRIGYLSQALAEMTGADRVIDAVENRRRISQLAGGREVSADTLLKDFGFTGDKLTARIADLSGGERRRLQFLRHPARRAERAVARRADQRPRHRHADRDRGLPRRLAGNVDRRHARPVLPRTRHRRHVCAHRQRALRPAARRHRAVPGRPRSHRSRSRPDANRSEGESASARERRAGKEMARIEGQLAKLDERIGAMHETMAAAAHDHIGLAELTAELNEHVGAQGIARRGVAGTAADE